MSATALANSERRCSVRFPAHFAPHNSKVFHLICNRPGRYLNPATLTRAASFHPQVRPRTSHEVFLPESIYSFVPGPAVSAPSNSPSSPDNRIPCVLVDCSPQSLVSDFDRVQAGFTIYFALEGRPKEGPKSGSHIPVKSLPAAPVEKCGGGDSAKRCSGATAVYHTTV